jgi:hypothetical protein
MKIFLPRLYGTMNELVIPIVELFPQWDKMKFLTPAMASEQR